MCNTLTEFVAVHCRVLAEKGKEVMFVRPKKLIRTSGTEALGYVDIRTLAEGMCRYDLNEADVSWMHIINEEFAEMGESGVGTGVGPAKTFLTLVSCKTEDESK